MQRVYRSSRYAMHLVPVMRRPTLLSRWNEDVTSLFYDPMSAYLIPVSVLVSG